MATTSATEAPPRFFPSKASASTQGGLEEIPEGDSDAGRRWDYQWADLPCGGTAYAFVDPPAGVAARGTAVLLHGINWHSDMSFHMVAGEVAAAAQVRVLVFDFLGRGRSAAPEGVRYTPELLVGQLVELLDYVSEEGNAGKGGEGEGETSSQFHVVGLSMGGAVATHFAAKHAVRVASLTLLAPAVVPVQMPFMAKAILLPGIGGALFGLFGPSQMLKKLHAERFAEDFIRPAQHVDLIDEFVRRIEWCIVSKTNFTQAFHSTLVEFDMSSGQLGAIDQVAKAGVPTLAVYGDADALFPLDGARAVFAERWPDADFAVVEGCGHALTVEAVRETNRLVAEHIRANIERAKASL
jgi:pimeloyl-ACP methyl ester carboxylesterase